MDIPLLNDILIIFGTGVFVIFVCHYLHVPTIVGLLLTGVVAGPHGLGLINDVENVETLSEIGIVTLLFTIGMDLSFQSLLQIRKAGLVSGPVQVGLSCICGFFLAKHFSLPFGPAVFMGFLLTHSSSTIMLKVFQERAELHSPQGRTSLAISIFQDVISIPMMLLIPILAGNNHTTTASAATPSPIILLIEGVLIILLAVLLSKYIVPQILYYIVRTRIHELFLISLFAMCFGVAWLTSQIGLSLALGAFLAGLIISESSYAQQALSDIMPFRDIFTSFFFVSVGMLLNVSFFFQHPWIILELTLLVIAVKSLIGCFATFVIGYPLRMMILVGIATSQIGEFSFVLAQSGLKGGLLTNDIYQVFLAVSILTMTLTPFLIGLSPRLAALITKLPLPIRQNPIAPEVPDVLQNELRDHLIVVGFGINGRNLARAARQTGIPYVILEMNPVTVKNESKKGEPIYFGDATQRAVLDNLGIRTARVMVVAISDAIATRRIVSVARRMNPNVYLISRTRFLQEMEPLYKLGSDEVIPEDFETSVEIFSRVLRKYLVPREDIEKFVADVRADNYEMFRSLTRVDSSVSDVKMTLPNIDIISLRVGETSAVVDRTIGEINLRKNYGVTLLAIQRGSDTLTNPGGEITLLKNDKLIVLGSPEQLASIRKLFT
jgi:CPA2 family monovalent cation:H+ antiporter-2